MIFNIISDSLGEFFSAMTISFVERQREGERERDFGGLSFLDEHERKNLISKGTISYSLSTSGSALRPLCSLK